MNEPSSTIHHPPSPPLLNRESPWQVLRREINPQATTPPESENAPANALDFRSSDQTLDRYKEVISVSGWALQNYRKNPVVQNAHSYGSLMDTIGKSIITEVRASSTASPYLFQRIVFAVEENPLAKLAYGLYKGGFLNAVSVGFIPLRWENGTKEAAYRRKYLEQELLEVSAVSIPANPNAITMGLRAGAVAKGDIKELVDLLRQSCEEVQSLPSDAEQAAWLQLTKQMNEIRAILKRG